MRYFAYIAEQSFKTGPNGERLFYTGGPWTRPYIIPDAETEQKLFRRQLWSLRILLGALILLMPVALIAFPGFSTNSWYFFGILVAAVALFWLASQLVIRPVLKRLERAPAQLSLGAFYRQMSEKHSARMLWLGFGASLLFVATSAWAVRAGDMAAPIAIFSMAFFGLCALAWGYALLLKRRTPAGNR